MVKLIGGGVIMGDMRGPSDNGPDAVGGDSSRFPWMQPVNEDLVVDVEPDGPNYMLLSASVVVLILFSAFIYYIYTQGQGIDNNGEIQVIKADDTPTRVEPEVRGGIEVPHQERLVFDRVSGETTPVEDNLRTAPEEPLSLEVPLEDEVVAMKGEDVGSREAIGVEPEARVAAVLSDDVQGNDIQDSGIQGNDMTTPKARYLVQVGAFGSLDAADKFWAGLQGKYPVILKGLSDEVQRAELGARVLYRLRIGYMLTRGEADRVCSDLKSRGQDCMVVNPE